MNISGSNPSRLTVSSISPENFNFLESVEAAHSSHSFNDRVSSLLGITRNPMRMDSQAKYGCLARGEGGAYLRMPTGVGYQEKIWVQLYLYVHTIADDRSVRIMPPGVS
jgi:3'(2'), 5'-bisphosphate nucleotidase